MTVGEKDDMLLSLLKIRPAVVSILPLLPLLVDTAIDSSNIDSIGKASDILCNYKHSSQIKNRILSLAAVYLISNDEWHYRRIIELYQLMNYKNEVIDFLSICRTNANPEIQEIADDF